MDLIAYLLTQLDYPDFPVPMGVFRSVEKTTYEDQLHAQVAKAKEMNPNATLDDLFRRGAETWTIEPPAKKGDTVHGKVASVDANEMEIGEEKESYEADLIEDEKVASGLEKAIRTARLKDVPAQTTTLVVPRTMNVADTLEKMQKRVEYDLAYIRHWALWLDLKIIWLTIVGGMGGRNAY